MPGTQLVKSSENVSNLILPLLDIDSHNCQKCQTQNEENTQFCRNCGTNLHLNQESQTNTKKADTFILIFLIYLFVSSFIAFVFKKFVDNWYEGTTKYIQFAMNIIYAFTPILVSMAIKNKVAKKVGIILASIVAVYIIYSNINWITANIVYK